MKLLRMKKIYSLLAVFLFISGCSTKGNVFSLEIGQCFQDDLILTETEIENVDRIDCKNPHVNEVYEIADLPAGDYPLAGVLERNVLDICYDAFEPYVGQAYEYSIYDIGALWPSQDSWEKADDREITCYLYEMTGQKKTGTAANSGL